MSLVSNQLVADDPRIGRLVAGNITDPHLPPELQLAARTDGDIPRAWRAKGYETVTSLVGAYIGRPMNISVVRNWWRFDLAAGYSRFLPPPDSIIRRKGGSLLPGWADETIREWMSTWEDERDWTTYLQWDAQNDEIDPRVITLIEDNESRGVTFNTPRPSIFEIEGAEFPLPSSYLTLGYDFAAQVASKVQHRTMGPNTLTHYWQDDIQRTDTNGLPFPYSYYAPVPDTVILRGPRADLLPGWTWDTIETWVLNRPGPGNHTRGEQRTAHNGKADMARRQVIPA